MARPLLLEARMRLFASALLLLFALTAHRHAHAKDSEPRETDAVVFGGVGMAHLRPDEGEGSPSNIPAAGAEALFRWRFLAAGLGGSLESVLFFNVLEGGALAGFWIDTSPLHVDLLGAIGIRSYSGWGRGIILSNDPGTGAVLPFAGGRLRLAYLIERDGKRPAYVGVVFGADDDLHRAKRRYTYVQSNLCIFDCPEDAVVERSRTVGTAQFVVLLTAGVAVPFP